MSNCFRIPNLSRHGITNARLGAIPERHYLAVCKYSQLHLNVKYDHDNEHDDHITSRLQQPQRVGAWSPMPSCLGIG